jgi:formylglycine-generating enzyme required for sulfatase activity
MLEKSMAKMRKLLFLLALVPMIYSCSNSGNGQLTGVKDRPDYYQQRPFGMLFIPMGSYVMGNSDQDVPYSNLAPGKTVTVQSFYMDETEITNNEYRQFVYWVRDSIAHTILGELDDPDSLWPALQNRPEDQRGDRVWSNHALQAHQLGYGDQVGWLWYR